MTSLGERFRAALPAGVDFCSVRRVRESTELLSVRRGVIQPPREGESAGAMITVTKGRGRGYAATADLSISGLRAAMDEATRWAERTEGLSLFDAPPAEHHRARWETKTEQHRSAMSLGGTLDLLVARARELRPSELVVDWEASLLFTDAESEYLTSGGGEVTQTTRVISPDLSVVASRGTETQKRSFGGRGLTQQGGLEVLDRVGFHTQGPVLAAEACALLDAPNCPTGPRDLLLAPDQMILQIHESIGHPLELDRILGDERNYAGTSFVTLDMFGTYRYASELLDVTFDPDREGELGSYAIDDDGTRAVRAHIIRRGILERPLGGHISQHRAGLQGVANTRASSWNRPPIDRMANLNVEPGTSTLASMIERTKRGIYMKTNSSWSIDDARNKFQFGCEWAQLIEDGRLTTVVKNPSYRGESATFWRSLAGVGVAETVHVLGTPYCGKGEPNQVIRVGHASPACLFGDVAVFGGA